MKNEKYFEIMDNIDENYILDAAPVHKTKKHIPMKLILSAAVVAVVCASLFLGVNSIRKNEIKLTVDTSLCSELQVEEELIVNTDSIHSESVEVLQDVTADSRAHTTDPIADPDPVPDQVDGLPTLTAELLVSGMGQEGHLAYDISDLDKNSPFDPSRELKSLPVYKNLAYDPYTQEHPTSYLSRNEMRDIAEKIALRLNVHIEGHKCFDYLENEGFVDVTDDASITEGIIYYLLYTDKFTLIVGAFGQYSFSFNEGCAISLPHELIPSGDSPTSDETVRVFDYLSSYYSDYICVPNIVGAVTRDYNFYGELFDTSQNYYRLIKDDYEASILNFNFDNYSVKFSDDLTCVTQIGVPWDLERLTQKLGDYPVINYTEAVDALIEGKYLSTVAEDLCLNDGKVKKDNVHMTEIVYFKQSGNKFFIPYYKFYVLLDYHNEKSPENLKNYGIFYVPAVESRFFKNYSPTLGQWVLD